MSSRSSRTRDAHVSEPYRLTLPARRFTIRLLVVAVILVILHVLMWIAVLKNHWFLAQNEWTSLLDLDTEASFGTWFSSAMLLVAGLLTLMHARRGEPSARGRNWWWFIGYALLVASLDEVAGLHESLNSDPAFIAVFHHWTIPAAVLSAVVLVMMVPFLWRLPFRTRALMILAAVVYVSGAVGVEFATIGYETAGALATLSYNLWNAFEEGCEMIGVIIYIYALLDHMSGDPGKVAARMSIRR